METMERGLGLTGAMNTRDLGGLPVQDGRRVKPGRLFRAPGLGRLTDADVDVLGALGLIEIIDLRHGSEIDIAPPDRLPSGVHVAHIPIFDPHHAVFTNVAAILLGEPIDGEVTHTEDHTRRAMLEVYRWFVSASEARAGFAQALYRVVDAAGAPVLYHCSAGKDRTGWLSVILLHALGADRAVATADYLLTEAYAREGNEKILQALWRKRRLAPEPIRPALTTDPAYLDAAHDEVARRYGSMDGYLTDGLGLTAPARAALREALLD